MSCDIWADAARGCAYPPLLGSRRAQFARGPRTWLEDDAIDPYLENNGSRYSRTSLKGLEAERSSAAIAPHKALLTKDK